MFWAAEIRSAQPTNISKPHDIFRVVFLNNTTEYPQLVVVVMTRSAERDIDSVKHIFFFYFIFFGKNKKKKIFILSVLLATHIVNPHFVYIYSRNPNWFILYIYIYSGGGGSIVHFRFFKKKEYEWRTIYKNVCLKNRNFLDVTLEFTRHSPKTPSPRFFFILYILYIYFCVLILEIQKKKKKFWRRKKKKTHSRCCSPHLFRPLSHKK